MAKVSDVAKGLHINLGQKEMSKDLFLIKQEILNQQEVLRKTFLRVVRFCEKEDGTLPKGVADVLTVRTMKDILERLTFGNWSNPADFNAFLDHVGLPEGGPQEGRRLLAGLPAVRPRAARGRRRPSATDGPSRGPARDRSRSAGQMISSLSFSGSFGNGACGSVWYQKATEAMSSWSGR